MKNVRLHNASRVEGKKEPKEARAKVLRKLELARFILAVDARGKQSPRGWNRVSTVFLGRD
jgi:hypothetical protein